MPLNTDNMRMLIAVFALVSLVCADPTSTDPTETLSKSVAKSANSIPAPSEKESFYPSPQHPASYVQLVAKSLYGQHQQPVQAFIIAQPAYIPQHLLYSHAQQLLSYFHSRPGAKFHVVYGFQPPRATQYQQNHQAQPVYLEAAPQAPPEPSQNYVNYPYPSQPQGNHYGSYLAVPAHVAIAPTHYTQTPTYAQNPATYSPPEVQPQPISSSLPASSGGHVSYDTHYYSQGPQVFDQPPQPPTNIFRTTAPIITGLEHFSPEQQAQIKQQLSSHFGGLTQINSNSVQASGNHEFSALAGSKLNINMQQESNDYSGAQILSNHIKPEAYVDGGSTRHGRVQYRQAATGTHYGPLTFRYRTPKYIKG